MNICLAVTWYPRGELPRFSRLLSMLEEEYARIVILLLPCEDQAVMDQLAAPEFLSDPQLVIQRNDNRRMGRYLAIKHALQAQCEFIHYADMDRLLHWVETQPQEWLQMVQEVEKHECIIFGRTEQAFSTHPQALSSTETISNRVVSFFMKSDFDVSAGSKSFSRKAAQYIVDHCQSDNSIGSDAEWPIVLKKAGLQPIYIPVNGLDWESADQYRLQAATMEIQMQSAREYDANPEHWQQRIEIADEIIRTAFSVAHNRYPSIEEAKESPLEFDFDEVFEIDDYMYFYSDSLTDERTDAEVSALVSLLKLDQPRKILDLACGFGRHTNRLAGLGHQITGVDRSEDFLNHARQDALSRKVEVRYQKGDMRYINFENEFEIVMLLFTAFGYFSDEENLEVLIKIRNALLPGGRLIFDTHNRDTFMKYMLPFFVVEKEGNLMIDRNTFDSIKGKSHNRRIVIRDGNRKDKPFSIRYYNASEIKALLIQAGLELVHLYGGWDGKDLSAESRRMLVVARKPE